MRKWVGTVSVVAVAAAGWRAWSRSRDASVRQPLISREDWPPVPVRAGSGASGNGAAAR